MCLLQDISECYVHLYMHEDALEFANMAVSKAQPEEKADTYHAVLYLKAMSLAYLGQFDESTKILKQINLPEEVQFVDVFRE